MNAVIRAIGGGLRTTFIGGASLFRFAPIIPLLAIVPEFVQHIAEIKLGMFASKDAFNALAMDPTRWAFGYAKLTGLALAIFAAARFHGGARHRWWDLRTIAWGPFLIAIGVNAVVTAIGYALGQVLSGTTLQVVTVLYQIATLPMLIFLVGPLLGDRSMTLRRAYTSGWLRALLAGALFMLAALPAQQLHQLDHTLAMGQPSAVVWGLMTWDSLLVGLMACWMGSGLAAGYWLGRPPATGGDRSGTPIHPASTA
ncbi:hypothetical protein F7D01_08380 [Erythrobacter sp. 3-20A1M]|uniref:hypothetical protein n=1 Tax=Erythrobacter sp. 3-20A1M TaxID=2653850 RepID=UPI001BFC6BD3|nr:hypothetical protein [Erythrobacter sp. 3-20A1M]QWC57099.1 hypothetical protein F7D01_08380 [Erythrobacter sp. 3-20A1M]